MENPTKKDDLGGKPTIFGNIHMVWIFFLRISYIVQLKYHGGKWIFLDPKDQRILEIPP